MSTIHRYDSATFESPSRVLEMDEREINRKISQGIDRDILKENGRTPVRFGSGVDYDAGRDRRSPIRSQLGMDINAFKDARTPTRLVVRNDVDPVKERRSPTKAQPTKAQPSNVETNALKDQRLGHSRYDTDSFRERRSPAKAGKSRSPLHRATAADSNNTTNNAEYIFNNHSHLHQLQEENSRLIKEVSNLKAELTKMELRRDSLDEALQSCSGDLLLEKQRVVELEQREKYMKLEIENLKEANSSIPKLNGKIDFYKNHINTLQKSNLELDNMRVRQLAKLEQLVAQRTLWRKHCRCFVPSDKREAHRETQKETQRQVSSEAEKMPNGPPETSACAEARANNNDASSVKANNPPFNADQMLSMLEEVKKLLTSLLSSPVERDVGLLRNEALELLKIYFANEIETAAAKAFGNKKAADRVSATQRKDDCGNGNCSDSDSDINSDDASKGLVSDDVDSKTKKSSNSPIPISQPVSKPSKPHISDEGASRTDAEISTPVKDSSSTVNLVKDQQKSISPERAVSASSFTPKVQLNIYLNTKQNGDWKQQDLVLENVAYSPDVEKSSKEAGRRVSNSESTEKPELENSQSESNMPLKTTTITVCSPPAKEDCKRQSGRSEKQSSSQESGADASNRNHKSDDEPVHFPASSSRVSKKMIDHASQNNFTRQKDKIDQQSPPVTPTRLSSGDVLQQYSKSISGIISPPDWHAGAKSVKGPSESVKDYCSGGRYPPENIPDSDPTISPRHQQPISSQFKMHPEATSTRKSAHFVNSREPTQYAKGQANPYSTTTTTSTATTTETDEMLLTPDASPEIDCEGCFGKEDITGSKLLGDYVRYEKQCS